MQNNTLIVIDIQKEYNTKGRPFYLKGIEPSLKNCELILNAARKAKWNIIHIKHYRMHGAIFNSDDTHSEFIAEFAPLPEESVIIKNKYSCFSSEDFVRYIKNHANDKFYMIGYNTIMCCLSTAIEAYHRNYRFTLVEDASYAKATSEFSEQEMHRFSMSTIRTASYVDLITTKELLNFSE